MEELQQAQKDALAKMCKGFYLTTQNKKEGLCVGNDCNLVKHYIENGTIEKLLEKKLIRPSINNDNVFLLTDAGRAYRKI